MKYLLLFLCSLGLACLANPGMPLPGLAFVALVPLFLVLDRVGRLGQVLLPLVWAWAWWCWSVWWLVPAAVDFIGLGPGLAVAIWLVICLLLALPYLVLGVLWAWLRLPDPYLRALARALAYALVFCWLADIIPGHVTHGLYVYPRLIQIVDIGGFALLLFVVVLVNALLVEAVTLHKGRWKPVVMAACLPLCLLAYGHYRIGQLEAMEGQTLSIGLLQPNLKREDTIEALLEQTRGLAARHPELDLLAWPEFPPAFSWSEEPSDRARVNALLAQVGKPLLLNSGYVYANAEDTNGGARPYYNAAQLISPEGELLGSYHKEKLVPFFEYLPLEGRWLTLRQWFPHSLNYVPGSGNLPISLSAGVEIAPLICYEMIFPEYALAQVQAGADIFINLSNDGWFGQSRGSVSHLALALFRSVEHHRPWVRVTNSGISVVASAAGALSLQEQLPPYQASAAVAEVNMPRFDSLYSRYPKGFACLGLGGLVLLLGWGWWRGRR